MNRVIVEVGSTNTKIDLYDGDKIHRLKEITILFKQNYKEKGCLFNDDITCLINEVNKLKTKFKDIYVCGTSVFRDLNEVEKKEFLTLFKNQTDLEFHIISQVEENNLTVIGSTRFINEPACVLVGGGGSTEISFFDKEIMQSKNSSIGVIDVLEKFPDLGDDIASTKLEEVMAFINDRLIVPDVTADILILSGGGHEFFARNSGIAYEINSLYTDPNAEIMMSIESRKKETKRFYTEISLDEIRNRVDNPDWWFATRAMCVFVLVVAEKIGAKYIVPTNISMVYGILESKENI